MEPCPQYTHSDVATTVRISHYNKNDNTEEFEIVLNAVHPAAQGKGVYTALVRAALLLAKDAGARRMIVSTQINNYAVQRVWTRLGFFHSSSLYTFHKWYDR